MEVKLFYVGAYSAVIVRGNGLPELMFLASFRGDTARIQALEFCWGQGWEPVVAWA